MIVSTSFLALAMMADAAASGKAAPPTDPQDKVICRTILETGSLVKGKRVCLTKREWALASEKGRQRAEEMQTLITTEQGR